MLVWVPDTDAVQRLAGLPDAVRVEAIPSDPVRSADAPNVEVLVPGMLDREVLGRLLPALPALRLVQNLGAGVDSVVGLVPDGVVLCDGRGVHDVAVAEWVLAAILADYKRLPELLALQRAGEWRQQGVRELDGASVLIVGQGSIGAATRARLEPFGARVQGVARHERDGVASMDRLPSLLPDADVVVVLVPLTSETRHLVDARFLAAMHEGALLVNAARGAVVDTDALLGALRSGHVRAALDVTDPEPLPAEHPLWHAPGILVTPHVAGWVDRFPERAYALVRAQVERLQAGQPLVNIVGNEGY